MIASSMFRSGKILGDTGPERRTYEQNVSQVRPESILSLAKSIIALLEIIFWLVPGIC